MSESLISTLTRRAQELHREITLLQARLKEIESLRDLLLQETPKKSGAPETSAEGEAASTPAQRPSRKLTIKDMALDVMKRRGRESASAREILSWINNDFDRNLERTSLSPQLSRLKDSGELTYNPHSKMWLLPSDRQSESSPRKS
ncbi:hypothetical protein [Paracoccus aeridis]|uniref:hypothetical protein n=1 Tax=Paracoccus aeridis TaxID=1966466 RepID=UPI0010AACB70|nr:hypothetical protein [Paracoccus aeridis]